MYSGQTHHATGVLNVMTGVLTTVSVSAAILGKDQMLIKIIALVLNEIEDAREKLRSKPEPVLDLSVTRLDTEINKDQVYEQTHDHIIGFSSENHRGSPEGTGNKLS